MPGLDSWKNKKSEWCLQSEVIFCHTLPRVGLSKILESNGLPWVFMVFLIQHRDRPLKGAGERLDG